MNNINLLFSFKKIAMNGIISEEFCNFAQTNHNNYAQMRLRYLFLYVLMSVFIAPAEAQTSAGSNIASRTRLLSDGTRKVEQRVYDNGLGDAVEEILSYTGSALPSVVVRHEYDDYRRRTRTWLPVTTSGNSFVSSSTIASLAQSQYDSDSAPFSRTEYDGFLPSQPSAQYKAGSLWQNSNKKVRVTYSEYLGAGMYSPTDGILYITADTAKFLCTRTVDEDSCWSAQYTDLNGRLMISETSQGKTYYMYDPKGDVTHVFPPILSEYLVSHYGYDSEFFYDNDAMIQKYGYIYHYDKQRRCIYKKLPGCEPVYYVYDSTGACILTQDGNQRQRGEWSYSIPDRFGRPCLSGICHNSVSYTAEPLHSYFVYAEYDGTTAATGGYTVHNITLSQQTMYSAAYYDDYTFIGHHGVPASLTYSAVSGFPADTSVKHAMQTGSATAILRGGGVTGYVYSAMYYDSRYNVAQVRSTNHVGGTDVTCTLYSYSGKPMSVKTLHTEGGTVTTEIDNTYTYDGADRQNTHTISVDNGSSSATATLSYAYDNLGRVWKITRPFTGNSSKDVVYDYDLHGWLKKITTNHFTEDLLYANGLGTPCYNGNVSTVKWEDMMSSQPRGYKLTYDDAGRLVQGVYGEGSALTSNAGRFSEGVQYDANGNITSIIRYGKNSSGGYSLMDNLTLSYSGNRLTGVSETVTDNSTSGSFEYKKAKGSQYMYDNNGSLMADKSRGIAYITYDANSNPSCIYFTNGNVTKYVYSATGQKLRAVYYTAKPNITRTFGVQPAELTQSQILYSDSIDYFLGGSLLLKNGQTDKYLFDGGYVRSNATTGNFSFFYYNKDHLGNNREVLDHRGAVRQVTSYYPFGAPYADDAAISGTGIQPYKYNGKELDLMHGLNTYDYGARQYYSILGRWDRVDPLCEKYYSTSPYVYCENDPVNAIDPDGRFGFKVLAKAAYKVGKTVAKNGLSSLTKSATYAAAFNDVVEDANTVFDSNASTGDRVVAGLSLLSEVIGPVSYKEGKTFISSVKRLNQKDKLQESAKIGQEAHRQIEKELYDAFGAIPEVKVDLPKRAVRKDAKMPDGKYVIIKPDTPSGHKAARTRQNLMEKNGRETITLFYNPQNPAYQPGSSSYIGPHTK